MPTEWMFADVGCCWIPMSKTEILSWKNQDPKEHLGTHSARFSNTAVFLGWRMFSLCLLIASPVWRLSSWPHVSRWDCGQPAQRVFMDSSWFNKRIMFERTTASETTHQRFSTQWGRCAVDKVVTQPHAICSWWRSFFLFSSAHVSSAASHC